MPVAPDARGHPPPLSFLKGCLAEFSLLLVALLWNWTSGTRVFGGLQFSAKDAVLGATAAVPLLAFFLWSLRADFPVLVEHRQWMDAIVRPLFRNWSVLQLLAISLLAGVCEEVFFRGVVQAGLSTLLGRTAGLLLASAIFGCAHLLTITYAIIAALLGLYLGWLWMASGNLLVPVAAHAVYDALALLWFLRLSSPRSGD